MHAAYSAAAFIDAFGGIAAAMGPGVFVSAGRREAAPVNIRER
jgi:hypothetical protein